MMSKTAVLSLLAFSLSSTAFMPRTPLARLGSSSPFESSTLVRAAATASISARDSGLALLLDDGTRKSHSMAENTAFVAGFFRGMSSKSSFGKLTASLYFIYDAMEAAFEDPAAAEEVRQMDYDSLRRKASLEKDMGYYFGSSWRTAVKPSPNTQKYVDRINALRGGAEDQKYLLVAHQYTRYLGDLFGGQMMAGMATKSLGLDGGGAGIQFYDFPAIDDNRKFIEEWYSQSNQLRFSEQEKQALVDEANLVFALNIGVFDELEGSAAGAVWRVAAAAFMERLREANPVIRQWAD
mmetsp:Transcript_6304/g.13032  ORF Transcript_6304/g.13032 Transcript_6304/m.13032 type:complete len:295 (-) Transcript_6304:254-1138(-)